MIATITINMCDSIYIILQGGTNMDSGTLTLIQTILNFILKLISFFKNSKED